MSYYLYIRDGRFHVAIAAGRYASGRVKYVRRSTGVEIPAANLSRLEAAYKSKQHPPRNHWTAEERQAHAIADQLVEEIADGVAGADPPIAEYFKGFWKSDGAYANEFRSAGLPISERHLKNRRNETKRFINWCNEQGLGYVSELTPAVIHAYRDLVSAQGIAPGTKNNRLRAIYIPIGRLVELGRLRRDPRPTSRTTAEKLAARKYRKNPTSGRVAFEPSQLQEILKPEHWDDLLARLGAELALMCALRRSELRGLKWDVIRPKATELDVIRGYTDDDGLKAPKWEHVRENVPVPPSLMRELNAIREEHHGYVFQEDNGPVPPEYFFDALRLAGSRCDPLIEINRRLGFHSLRHSYVTASEARIIEQRRAALRTVAGHASPEAQDHYRHTLRSEEERIAAEWDLWRIEKKLTLLDAGEHPGLSVFDLDKLSADEGQAATS